MEPEHFALYSDLAICDAGDDGTIDECDLMNCIADVENLWRD
jgi:hypothetical protein